MNLLLKIKHWQLFSLIIGPQVLINILHNNVGSYIEVFSKVLNILIVLGWLWTVGIILIKNYQLDFKHFWFKIAFFWLAFYFSYSSFTNLNIYVSEIDREWIINKWGLWLPHLLFMASAIYCFGFCARTVRTIELGRVASLSQYFGYGFLILLFPFGIWFLQPKLNRMTEGDVSPT